MISVCPNCGYSLQQELCNGLSHCKHCNKVFDSNVFNELLAASWLLRKQNLTIEQLEWQTKLDKDLTNFVYYFVSTLEYSHDEFVHLLKKLQK
jgi:hypothetical protein